MVRRTGSGRGRRAPSSPLTLGDSVTQSIRMRFSVHTACDRVIVALVAELGLHRVKEITIEDGGLLAGEDLVLEGDLADVEPIAQKMGERAAGKWDAADRAPGLERSHLGDDPPLAKVGHQHVEA